MQLFESYHFISWAVMALVLLALLIFYIISLRLTVKRQVCIIKSLRQQLQNLLDPSASVEAVQIISFPKYRVRIWAMRHLRH